MEKFQEKEILKYKCSSCYKKLLFTSIFIIVLASIIASIAIIIMFSSEARSQLEFNKPTSAGNCRIVNTKYEYDNNFSIEMHYFIKVDTENRNKYIKGIHLYAIDQDKKIYDISNNTKTIGSSYEEYINKRNIIYDELLVSGQFNEENFNTNIHEYLNITALTSLIALPIYYYTYKFMNK